MCGVELYGYCFVREVVEFVDVGGVFVNYDGVGVVDVRYVE